MGRIGSTKLVLPKWHKYGTLNRVIRVPRPDSAGFITEEVKMNRPLGHLLLSPKVRVLKIQGPYRDR